MPHRWGNRRYTAQNAGNRCRGGYPAAKPPPAPGSRVRWKPASSPRQQFHARQQCLVRKNHLLHAIDGGNQGLPGLDQTVELAAGEKVGPEERANQASTSRQLMALHPVLEFLGPIQVPVRATFKKFIVTGDRLVQLRHCVTKMMCSDLEYRT